MKHFSALVCKAKFAFNKTLSAISVQECIFLGMQKFLPKFDLAFPIMYKQQVLMLRLKRTIVN